MSEQKGQSGPGQSLATMSPEQVGQNMGWDVPRVWATGVQFLLNDQNVIIVFREQVIFEAPEPDQPATVFGKNVASVVLPLSVAREMRDIMQRLIPDAE